MGYSSEIDVEELESEYNDSEDIFESPRIPFGCIPYRPQLFFLLNFSFQYNDFESEGEVGWHTMSRISKKAVDVMPMVKIDRSINCPICLEEFVISEEAKEMPCEHKFHRECIVPWLKTRCSCPLCRVEMPADDLEDSNKSYGVDSDRVEFDDDSGSRESRQSVRFRFFPLLWSHVYENSYGNGSDGGASDDREEGDNNNDNDSVGGDDGEAGIPVVLTLVFSSSVVHVEATRAFIQCDDLFHLLLEANFPWMQQRAFHGE